jgi:hypothetical protein
MLGTATTASDYKRPLDTLRMAINGNEAEWAGAMAVAKPTRQSMTKKSMLPRPVEGRCPAPPGMAEFGPRWGPSFRDYPWRVRDDKVELERRQVSPREIARLFNAERERRKLGPALRYAVFRPSRST